MNFRCIVASCITLLVFTAASAASPGNDQAPVVATSVPDDIKEQINQAIDSGDGTTASRLLRPFAEGGNTEAQTMLGGLYLKGVGIPQNLVEAKNWISLAATNGDHGAQYIMGTAYRYGTFGTKDEYEAYRYLRASAEQGFTLAQFELGTLLSTGDFEGGPAVTILGSRTPSRSEIPKNAVEAVHWYRAAADQGMPEAQYNLGVSYSKGQGVPVNLTEAIRYYRMAAKQGNALAQNNLGAAYANGNGVQRDYIRAFMWTSISASQGGYTAEENLELNSARLTPRQRAQAEQMAARCVATEYEDCD